MTAETLDYPLKVWRLFQDSPRAGAFPATQAGVARVEVGTPAARFRLRLELKRGESGLIEDVRFSALGCPFTIAVGAWLAEWAMGRSASEIKAFSAEECRSALEIPADRAHCWLMAQDLMRALTVILHPDPE